MFFHLIPTIPMYQFLWIWGSLPWPKVMLSCCVCANLSLETLKQCTHCVWCLFFVRTRQNCASGIQMEPGSHVNASVRTWIFWTVSNLTTPPVILQPCGLNISPCNYTVTSDPNESLLNKHPYILPTLIIFLFFFWPYLQACRTSWPGIEPMPLAVEAQS